MGSSGFTFDSASFARALDRLEALKLDEVRAAAYRQSSSRDEADCQCEASRASAPAAKLDARPDLDSFFERFAYKGT
jgi:hypothetical protein